MGAESERGAFALRTHAAWVRSRRPDILRKPVQDPAVQNVVVQLGPPFASCRGSSEVTMIVRSARLPLVLVPLLSACAMETPHTTDALDPFPATATAGTLVVDLVDGTSLDDARKAT